MKHAQDILDHVARHGQIRNAEARALTGISSSRAAQILAALVDSGQLDRHGESRASVYVTPGAPAPTAEPQPAPAPMALAFDCADCKRPVDGIPIEGRCTPCHLAHGIATYAAELGIDATVVRPNGGPARVTATDPLGRLAWLDSHTDALYLSRDLVYDPVTAPRTTGTSRIRAANVPDGWAHGHDACRECDRTDRRHFARGYCTACYTRLRRARIAAAAPASIAA
jgi:hypothetical protein